MINIESMKIDKNNIYVNIIFISIFLIFLDAYEVFSIPISWIGLTFLLIPALLEGKAISNSGNIKIHTPLIDLKKFEIIQKANLLDLNFKMTHSCYDPDETNGRSCGNCDSCILRLAGFREAKINDPISYDK